MAVSTAQRFTLANFVTETIVIKTETSTIPITTKPGGTFPRSLSISLDLGRGYILSSLNYYR